MFSEKQNETKKENTQKKNISHRSNVDLTKPGQNRCTLLIPNVEMVKNRSDCVGTPASEEQRPPPNVAVTLLIVKAHSAALCTLWSGVKRNKEPGGGRSGVRTPSPGPSKHHGGSAES